MTVEITEKFDDSQGRFQNYDTYDNDMRVVMAEQKHIDIRSFIYNNIQISSNLSQIDGDTMAELDSMSMSALEAPLVVKGGEQWGSPDGGVAFGPDSTRNHWNDLRGTLQPGANIYSSELPDEPVDLETNFEDTDFISCAFPGFPIAVVTVSDSYIYFTSKDDGFFDDPDQVAYVPFATSDPALINGNCEARWTRGSLIKGDAFDLSHVTGVQFRITSPDGGATFKAAGFRLLSADWKYLPLDIDTRYQVLRPTVSRTGLTTTPYDYQFPTVWRADTPSGNTDPRPVDGSLAITFNTGSLTQANQVSIYMRENTDDFMTQLDLNGQTQAGLNGLPQPDIGAALWDPRPQSDIDRYTQADLDNDQQFTLERTPDLLASSYIEFVFQWSSSGGTVLMRNSEGNGYSFTVTGLTANSNYICIAELDDTKARTSVYPIDAAGNIDSQNLLFDSGWVDDDFVFKRRKGRVGWYAQLLDGDSWIEDINTRGMTYAEQRLLPYESITPAVGSQLFAEFSPDIELVGGVSERNGSSISLDTSRSRSDESYRVDVTGVGQGLETNVFLIDNFDEADLRFSTYVSQSALDDGAILQGYLVNDKGRTIHLNLGNVFPDQWNDHHLPLTNLGRFVQTGAYRFVIVNQSNLTYSFWIDKPISLTERRVRWSGRAVVDDPWKSNDAKWTDFDDQVNKTDGGILFYKRGNQLQIRARALSQDAHIGQIKVKPKYAELGRLVFTPPNVTNAPTAVFTSGSPVGRTVSFDGSSSHGSQTIIQHEWSFGDGSSDFGKVVSHTYVQAGTYTVTLTVVDFNGMRSAVTHTVTV